MGVGVYCLNKGCVMRTELEIESRFGYLKNRLITLRAQEAEARSYSEGIDIANTIRGLEVEYNTLKWVLNK